jgi:hypothetical protein
VSTETSKQLVRSRANQDTLNSLDFLPQLSVLDIYKVNIIGTPINGGIASGGDK